MLAWIKKKLRKWLELPVPVSAPVGKVADETTAEGPLPEGCDLFRPEERLIFKYFDGSETIVRADPLVLYRRMMEIAPELSTDISLARSQHKDADKAYLAMIARMRSVFNVKGFEDGGLTESETVSLFDKFNAYCEEIQKKTKNSVTSQGATPPTSAPFIPGGPPSPNGSASGSTAAGPSTGMPQPPSTA